MMELVTLLKQSEQSDIELPKTKRDTTQHCESSETRKRSKASTPTLMKLLLTLLTASMPLLSPPTADAARPKGFLDAQQRDGEMGFKEYLDRKLFSQVPPPTWQDQQQLEQVLNNSVLFIKQGTLTNQVLLAALRMDFNIHEIDSLFAYQKDALYIMAEQLKITLPTVRQMDWKQALIHNSNAHLVPRGRQKRQPVSTSDTYHMKGTRLYRDVAKVEESLKSEPEEVAQYVQALQQRLQTILSGGQAPGESISNSLALYLEDHKDSLRMAPTPAVLYAMELEDTLRQLSPPSKTAIPYDTLTSRLLPNVVPGDGWEFADHVIKQITNRTNDGDVISYAERRKRHEQQQMEEDFNPLSCPPDHGPCNDLVKALKERFQQMPPRQLKLGLAIYMASRMITSISHDLEHCHERHPTSEGYDTCL